jgi:hypothetical protein
MYIVGQERRLVNPPSQVVAGVRTVTTIMDGRDVLPRLSRPFAFSELQFPKPIKSNHFETNQNREHQRLGETLNKSLE